MFNKLKMLFSIPDSNQYEIAHANLTNLLDSVKGEQLSKVVSTLNKLYMPDHNDSQALNDLHDKRDQVVHDFTVCNINTIDQRAKFLFLNQHGGLPMNLIYSNTSKMFLFEDL